MKFAKQAKLITLITLFATLGSTEIANGAVVSKLSSSQKAQLQYLVEEEKLARDVYTYLAKNVTTQKFSNILNSEQTHMNSISDLLKTYKISNPTVGKAVGVFKDPKLQSLYNSLIKTGSTSSTAAFGVGISIEKLDITDLQKMLKSTWPSDVKLALEKLLSGSQNHLKAFGG